MIHTLPLLLLSQAVVYVNCKTHLFWAAHQQNVPVQNVECKLCCKRLAALAFSPNVLHARSISFVCKRSNVNSGLRTVQLLDPALLPDGREHRLTIAAGVPALLRTRPLAVRQHTDHRRLHPLVQLLAPHPHDVGRRAIARERLQASETLSSAPPCAA